MPSNADMKIRVTGLGEFKRDLSQAQASVKTMDAELKRIESQYKITGDKTQYLAEKTNALQQRMQAQAAAAQAAKRALQQMDAQGVSKISTAYQRFQQQLAEAQNGMNETSLQLNNLTQSEQTAARGADQLTTSVNGINKKISLDAVISGIDRITSGMERAARKAVDLGQALWKEISGRASWADETATTAAQLNLGVEEYQRLQKTFDTVADITVSDWMKAKKQILQLINNPTDGQIDMLAALGIETHETFNGKNGIVQGAAKNYEDLLWEIGKTVNDRVKSGAISQDLADTYFMEFFGKGFMNMNPLFALGREGFEKAVASQNVVSEEAIQKMAELNDTVIKLQEDFRALETETLSGMAPALTKAATVLDSLLGKLMDYLETEDGQAMLERLGEAVSELFDDLGEIDPKNVVSNLASVFEQLIGGIDWLAKNKDGVIDAVKGIANAFGLLKVSQTVLTFMQMTKSAKNLFSQGATESAASAAASGAASGTAGTAAGAAASGAIQPRGFLNNMIQGLAVNSVLSMADQISQGAKIAADKTKSAEQRATEFVDHQIANHFIRPEDREKAIQDNLGLLKLTVPAEVEPKVEEGAAADIAAQIGAISIPVSLVYSLGGGGGHINGMTGQSVHINANGIPFVPFDGYISILHRGERVLPAQENRTYTANSNLYVQNMNMNNGMDAQALAAAMRAQQERTSKGFGS